MWIGALRTSGGSEIGTVVVGEDGDGYECVSLQEVAIGTALDRFVAGDKMIWDAERNAYFRLRGTTVVPLGSAAHEMLEGDASLAELQRVMTSMPKE